MRDINALNRSKTFLENWSANAIIVDPTKLAYYCYVDIFKDYIKKLPYYYGNCDVFINHKDFFAIKDIFVTKSVEKHPWLKQKFNYKINKNYHLIDNYFQKLFNL